jgi:hypothetical protein
MHNAWRLIYVVSNLLLVIQHRPGIYHTFVRLVRHSLWRAGPVKDEHPGYIDTWRAYCISPYPDSRMINTVDEFIRVHEAQDGRMVPPPAYPVRELPTSGEGRPLRSVTVMCDPPAITTQTSSNSTRHPPFLRAVVKNASEFSLRVSRGDSEIPPTNL